MLSNRVVVQSLLKRTLPNVTVTAQSHGGGHGHGLITVDRDIFGTREHVGFGLNCTKHYVDRADFPMPAIRFKEIKGDLVAIREKEKGDWKKLSIAEKKALYRASFCQTFAEFEAPTGEWKSVMGWTLFLMSIGIWTFILQKRYLVPPLPESFSEEHRAKMLRKVLDSRVGAIEGISSKWDYEKDDWKK